MNNDNQPKFPLHSAIINNQEDKIVQLIRDHQEYCKVFDDDNRTPLHWATSMSNENAIRQLLPYSDVNAKDGAGWTVYHIASSLPSISILQILDSNDDIRDNINWNSQTNAGLTCLHLAVSKKSLPVINFLLEKKVRLNIRDKRGQTAMHRAAANGSSQLITVLKKGPIDSSDLEGMRPLDLALMEGHPESAALLVKLGADSEVNWNKVGTEFRKEYLELIKA